jgi:thioredoxin 1
MKILKFYASWCSPCKDLETTINEIRDEIPYPFEDIDVENDSAGMIAKHEIVGIPTLVLLDGETEIRRHLGQFTVDTLREFVKVIAV